MSARKVVGLPAWYEDRAPVVRTGVLALTTAKRNLAPTLELASAYQAIFDYFNRELFERIFGEPLPNPILNMSRQRNAVAFFQSKAWKDPMTGDMLDEISLVPEWTGREPREVLSSIVHEMAHFRDHLDGTAAKGGYHGRSWFKIMARLGLPGKALSKTMLKVTHDIEDDGAFDRAYRAMPRDLLLPFITARPKVLAWDKKTTLQGKRVRYECPGCGNIVRGKTGMRLRCVDCDLDFGETGF